MWLALFSSLASALIALTIVQLATAAPLVQRPLISETLSVDISYLFPTLYRSTERYQCPPTHFLLSGKHGPFNVDVIRFPFEADDVASQEVIASVATGVSKEDRVMWLPQTYHTGEVAARVTDAEGNVGYSVMKRIEDGHGIRCTDLSPSWFSTSLPDFLEFLGQLCTLAVLVSLVFQLEELKRLIKGKAEGPPVAAETAAAKTVWQRGEDAGDDARLIMRKVPAYPEKAVF
ncbi:hypothetical protein JCM6882_006133 [Rhodosporidiobolus microsporus]